MHQESVRLADFMADDLTDSSVEITRRWLHDIAQRLGLRPRRVFPTDLVYDHIPAVIEAIATGLRSPGPPRVSDAVIRHLRNLALHRREQGYDVQEVLVEFAALGDVLFDRFADAVSRHPGAPDPVEVARLAARVHVGLLTIGTITTGTYRQAEVEHTRELSRLTSQYARTLSHELKNPIGAAEGAARMLSEEEIAAEPEQRRHLAELVLRSLRRAGELIDDVRVLAIAETGEAAIQRRARLADIVREVREEARQPAEEARVEIRVVEPVPDPVVDATRVELVLINLVGNAIKYADPRKPRRWVRIEAQRLNDEWWRASVADNGLGIPDRLKSHVFERFFRAHPEVDKGTGLGLSIAREAVDQMGGEIDFESDEGEGSTFWFTFRELGPGGAGAAHYEPGGVPAAG